MEIDGGRYRLIRRLGSGGTGIVYQAVDCVLGRTVAVKALHPHMTRDLLRGEGRSLAGLVHPNVVALHDLVEHDGRPFLIMEYVDGGNLEQWLAVHDTLSLDGALTLLGQIAAPVSAAHARGLLHLDLKPSNILITPTGQVKLVDFTLACPEHGGDPPSVRGGTIAYAAPEQLDGGPIDRRADVFALGTLLRRLTGPLTGSDARERQVLAVVARATASEPADRFAGIAGLLGALPVVDGAITQITADSRVDDLTRIQPGDMPSSRRQRVLWPLSLAPAAVVLAGAVLFSLRPVSASPPPVTVPGVRTAQSASATVVLRSLHLRVRTIWQYSGAAPSGVVLLQSPQAGAQLQPLSTVTLTVSRGPRPVAVPDLGGVSLTDARHTLEQRRLRIQVIPDETIFHTAGEVLSQSPPADVERVPGSVVTLTVSVKPGWWPF